MGKGTRISVLRLCSALGLLLNLSSYSQTKNFEHNGLKCRYTLTEEKFHGPYVSYYPDGSKKAEGRFNNNYRAGKWTLWDSTGKLTVQREYSDPFTFKCIVPQIPAFASPYQLTYENGYISYFPLKEKEIKVAKRIWRFLPAGSNPLLFEKESLFDLLYSNSKSKTIKIYGTADDEFRQETAPEKLDVSGLKIIGYNIKEDWFFETERKVSESRIIGICPVAIDQKGDTLELFWAWFPETRPVLSKINIAGKNLPANIKTLDDLFFFRCFASSIYKESNIHHRPIAAYTKTDIERKKEAERIEIEIIEMEHSLWLKY